MNIYDAIMVAADHIERHPEEFEYGCVQVPDYPGCGAPGCALGWIARFAGDGHWTGTWTDDLMDVHDVTFYRRMDGFDGQWKSDASACAAALRAYARKFHAPRTLDWESLAAPNAGTREEVST